MISKRLEAAALLLDKCEVFFDVGCDHGLLGLYMLETERARWVYFCDISGQSLKKARHRCEAMGLLPRATFLVNDGLAGLSPGRNDALSLCGMGGQTIARILKQGDLLPCGAVLQANTELAFLRRALCEKGYRIAQEKMVLEGGRYYTLMKIVPGQQELSELACRFGPCLLEKRDPLLFASIRRRIALLQPVIQNAPAGGAQEALEEMALLKEALQWEQPS